MGLLLGPCQTTLLMHKALHILSLSVSAAESSAYARLQVVLIVNSLVYLALSFITVPLYSIGVQMGSEFKPHIFMPDVTTDCRMKPEEQQDGIKASC